MSRMIAIWQCFDRHRPETGPRSHEGAALLLSGVRAEEWSRAKAHAAAPPFSRVERPQRGSRAVQSPSHPGRML